MDQPYCSHQADGYGSSSRIVYISVGLRGRKQSCFPTTLPHSLMLLLIKVQNSKRMLTENQCYVLAAGVYWCKSMRSMVNVDITPCQHLLSPTITPSGTRLSPRHINTQQQAIERNLNQQMTAVGKGSQPREILQIVKMIEKDQ